MKDAGKIRVLQFVEGLSQGGIEAFVVNVYKNLDLEKFECDFLVLKTAEASNLTYVYERELLDSGVKIQYLIDVDSTSQNSLFKSIKYLQLFRRWLQNGGKSYDVIHVHASHLANFYPYLLCMKYYGVKKIVLHSHNSTTGSKTSYIIHKIFRRMLKPVGVICLACGEEAGRWMFGSIPFKVIPNGIDLQKFHYSSLNRREIRKEFGINENTQILGHVGAFRDQKNHSYLIEIFYRYHKKNPDSKLFLVGDGQLRIDIEHLVQKKGLKESVVFLGNRKDVCRVLSAMDCFVFPSLYEGLSVAMVEVQANGVPVVMADTIDSETIMCNKVTVCKIDLTEACYTKWCELIRNAIDNGRKGIQYTNRFCEYDIINTVHKLEKIYE